jgi:hypothetical protein
MKCGYEVVVNKYICKINGLIENPHKLWGNNEEQ